MSNGILDSRSFGLLFANESFSMNGEIMREKKPNSCNMSHSFGPIACVSYPWVTNR